MDFYSLIEKLDTLTPDEAGKLSEIVQDKWGVKISDVPTPVPTVPIEAKAPEQTEFTVTLTGFGAAKKMDVIRVIRPIIGLGLKESKEFVESAPKIVKEGLTRAEAETLAKTLTDAGGGVTIS